MVNTENNMEEQGVKTAVVEEKDLELMREKYQKKMEDVEKKVFYV